MINELNRPKDTKYKYVCDRCNGIGYSVYKFRSRRCTWCKRTDVNGKIDTSIMRLIKNDS